MNVFFIILVDLFMKIYKSDIVWESITSTYYKKCHFIFKAEYVNVKSNVDYIVVNKACKAA
jgi:hypothetical protein